jgi:hypothetical protein
MSAADMATARDYAYHKGLTHEQFNYGLAHNPDAVHAVFGPLDPETLAARQKAEQERLEKEAEALAKSRNVSSNRSSGDVVDVIDVNTPREDEKSPLAMKMFVKVVGTFSKGVAGVSVRFIEHELRAVESIERQLSTKAA